MSSSMVSDIWNVSLIKVQSKTAHSHMPNYGAALEADEKANHQAWDFSLTISSDGKESGSHPMILSALHPSSTHLQLGPQIRIEKSALSLDLE